MLHVITPQPHPGVVVPLLTALPLSTPEHLQQHASEDRAKPRPLVTSNPGCKVTEGAPEVRDGRLVVVVMRAACRQERHEVYPQVPALLCPLL